MRIIVTLVCLFLLTPVAFGQEQKAAKTTELAPIRLYVKSIDQFARRNPKQRRFFGNTAGTGDTEDKWRLFKTARQLDQANPYERVEVWLKDDKVVLAKFSFTSESGDWYHYVNYYFREDGTLAKIHSQLNTFASADGGISVVRDKFYDSGGKVLHPSTRYLDLQSQKPRKRGDFMDQPIPVYKTVRELPFAKVL
jgi:hypothetical protein